MDNSEKVLKGKVVVVTGAGRGIGQGLAIGFARAGASVVCAARTMSDIEKTANDILALGEKAIAVQTDVTCTESVSNLFAKSAEAFGGIDILIINAGGNFENAAIENSNLENWKQTVDLNLYGAYYCAHFAIPYLKQRAAAKIIMIGAGKRGFSGFSAYCCAKAGARMLMNILGQELLPYKISVNELSPGPVQTVKNYDADKNNKILENEWHKLPEDVVPLALFLATQPEMGPTAQSFSLLRSDI
jgi:3-oxoacyl-[acyl-carrier protein] reductase